MQYLTLTLKTKKNIYIYLGVQKQPETKNLRKLVLGWGLLCTRKLFGPTLIGIIRNRVQCAEIQLMFVLAHSTRVDSIKGGCLRLPFSRLFSFSIGFGFGLLSLLPNSFSTSSFLSLRLQSPPILTTNRKVAKPGPGPQTRTQSMDPRNPKGTQGMRIPHLYPHPHPFPFGQMPCVV